MLCKTILRSYIIIRIVLKPIEQILENIFMRKLNIAIYKINFKYLNIFNTSMHIIPKKESCLQTPNTIIIQDQSLYITKLIFAQLLFK